MFSWWAVYDENGSFPSDLYSIPTIVYGDDFTVGLAYISFYIAIVLLGVFSLEVRHFSHFLVMTFSRYSLNE